jgi:hypothetical protein
MAAVAAGNLPPVSFVKPLGPNNEHPGYADLAGVRMPAGNPQLDPGDIATIVDWINAGAP